MKRHCTACLLVLGLLLVPFSLAVAEDAASPLTLVELRKMRQERKSHEEIVTAAQSRGVGFEIDNIIANQLKNMRFTPEQIETLKTIGTNPQAEPAAGEAADDAPAKVVNPDARCGPRKPEAWQEMQAEIMKQILVKSQVTAEPFEANSFFLVASKATAREHIGDLNRIQQILAKKYKGVFVSGLDRRSAHIVMLDDEYQYKAFIEAMFSVMAEKGIQFNSPNAKEMALGAASFSIDTIAVINLAKVQRGTQSRAAMVYQAGKLLMLHLTDGKATEAMVCGFGNVAEVLMYDKPTYTTTSYEPRAVQGGNSWANEVSKLIAENKIKPPETVLQTYTTSTMKLPNYAEAWSLMTVLSNEAGHFEPLVVAVRDAPENASVMQSVEAVYKIPAAKLFEAWVNFAR